MDCANAVEYPRSLKIREKCVTVFKFDDFLDVVERVMGIESRRFIERACDDSEASSTIRKLEDENGELIEERDSLNSRIEELEREKRVSENSSEKMKSEAEEWKGKFLQLQSRVNRLTGALLRDD